MPPYGRVISCRFKIKIGKTRFIEFYRFLVPLFGVVCNDVVTNDAEHEALAMTINNFI